MYLWWSSCTLYLCTHQVRVNIGNSGFCCLCLRYVFCANQQPCVLLRVKRESYRGWLGSLLLHLCNVFQGLINSLVCCQPAGQRRESFEVKRQQLNTMGGYYGGALGNMAPSPAGPGGLLQAGQSMTPPPSLSGSSSNLSISEPHPLIFPLACFYLLLLSVHLWPFQWDVNPGQKIWLLRNLFLKGMQFLCFVVVFVCLARRSKTMFKWGYGRANWFFSCQIKILHLWSFERPYIVSLKKYNYMLFSTPVAMETVQDGR